MALLIPDESGIKCPIGRVEEVSGGGRDPAGEFWMIPVYSGVVDRDRDAKSGEAARVGSGGVDLRESPVGAIFWRIEIHRARG
ncbi:hypothetical protein [Methylobacterium sp. GC_Met_2]|uniref:hypothetical protein n=1 Tax=Methylobacterium sp. GC_Met_2 TaxID=2937376 RepID=UPI00226B4AA4